MLPAVLRGMVRLGFLVCYRKGIDLMPAYRYGTGAERTEPWGRMRRAYPAVEFTALFIVLPSLYIRLRHIIYPIPALWCLAAVCSWLLKRDGYFTRSRLWGERSTRKQILLVVGRFTVIAITIGARSSLSVNGGNSGTGMPGDARASSK